MPPKVTAQVHEKVICPAFVLVEYLLTAFVQTTKRGARAKKEATKSDPTPTGADPSTNPFAALSQDGATPLNLPSVEPSVGYTWSA